MFSRDVQPLAAVIILMGLLPVAARFGSAHEHTLETFAKGRIQCHPRGVTFPVLMSLQEPPLPLVPLQVASLPSVFMVKVAASSHCGVHPEVWIMAGVLKAQHKSVGVEVSGSSCFVLNQSSRFRV